MRSLRRTGSMVKLREKKTKVKKNHIDSTIRDQHLREVYRIDQAHAHIADVKMQHKKELFQLRFSKDEAIQDVRVDMQLQKQQHELHQVKQQQFFAATLLLAHCLVRMNRT